MVEITTRLATRILAISLSMSIKSSTFERLLNAAMLNTVKISPGISDRYAGVSLFIGPKIIQMMEAYGMKRRIKSKDHFKKSLNIGAIEATNGPGP